MHTAASFQLHPGRFDVSAPGMSQDASFFEHSSLIKEKRTSELLSKWQISFKGEKRKDPESFIVELTNCKETYKLTLDEIVKTLPSALDGEAWQWFRREYQFWKTYEDFVDAFRLQYSFEDVQERLRKELEVCTRGPSEEISMYLLKVRDLLDQLKPPLTLGEQRPRLSEASSFVSAAYREEGLREFSGVAKSSGESVHATASNFGLSLSCFSVYPSETATTHEVSFSGANAAG